jgi:TatD DNase family protein
VVQSQAKIIEIVNSRTMPDLIDTHCHLDFDRFEEDRELAVERAVVAGVRRIVVPAIDLDNIQKVLSLAEKYEPVFAAVGVHPNSSAEWREGWLGHLRTSAKHPKVVAIGEIGLDYYRDWSPPPTQRIAFSAQVSLAGELGLPVIVHNRQADADILQILEEAKKKWSQLQGVLHSFSSSWETAASALEMGFYIGFTGPITYKKANDLRAVSAKIPLDRLLVETDSPFLAPQQFRGKRNEPAYVVDVAAKLADIRSMSLDEIARQTTANAERLFGEGLGRHEEK